MPKTPSKSPSAKPRARAQERRPVRLQATRKLIKGWRVRAARMTRVRPGRTVLGAFAAGLAVATLARLV